MKPLPFSTIVVRGERVGYLRTQTKKYFIGGDGILFISSIYDTEKSFGGVFRNGSLEEIPSRYVNGVSKILEKLTYMNSVIQDGRHI